MYPHHVKQKPRMQCALARTPGHPLFLTSDSLPRQGQIPFDYL